MLKRSENPDPLGLELCKDPVVTEIGIIIHAEKVTLQDMERV
ncbi:MAG: hypothetical protein PVH67_04055 [Desulfobacterales bacterium]